VADGERVKLETIDRRALRFLEQAIDLQEIGLIEFLLRGARPWGAWGGKCGTRFFPN